MMMNYQKPAITGMKKNRLLSLIHIHREIMKRKQQLKKQVCTTKTMKPNNGTKTIILRVFTGMAMTKALRTDTKKDIKMVDGTKDIILT